jgi:hypothetical protein
MTVSRVVDAFGSAGAIVTWPIAFSDALGGNLLRWNKARLGGLLEVVQTKQSFRYLRAFAAHCNTWFVLLLQDSIDVEAALASLNTFRNDLHLNNISPTLQRSPILSRSASSLARFPGMRDFRIPTRSISIKAPCLPGRTTHLGLSEDQAIEFQCTLRTSRVSQGPSVLPMQLSMQLCTR